MFVTFVVAVEGIFRLRGIAFERRQPHGPQFTIIQPAPEAARRFTVTWQILLVAPEHALRSVRFDEVWTVIEGTAK